MCDVDAVDKSQDVRVPKTRSTRVDSVNQNVDFSVSISSMVVNWFNTCQTTLWYRKTSGVTPLSLSLCVLVIVL